MNRYNEYDEKIAPPVKLQENRNPIKVILLSIFTLGIYSVYFFMTASFDINKIVGRHDGRKTMNYLFAALLSVITMSIVMDIWHHQFSERVGDELARRNIEYEFGAGTYWGWAFFGSLIIVGPFIYLYKVCRALNLLSAAYNEEAELEYKESAKIKY